MPVRFLYVVCFLVKSLTDLPELNYMSTHGGGDGGVANGGCRYEFTLAFAIRHTNTNVRMVYIRKFCTIFCRQLDWPIYQIQQGY